MGFPPLRPSNPYHRARPYKPLILPKPHVLPRRLFFATSLVDALSRRQVVKFTWAAAVPQSLRVNTCQKQKMHRPAQSWIEGRKKIDVSNPTVAPKVNRWKSNDASCSGARKVSRRRQIDPTTCERDYSDDEVEFMHALDCYKRSSGRMFPTCSEVLEVLRGLGYAKTLASAQNAVIAPPTTNESPLAQ